MHFAPSISLGSHWLISEHPALGGRNPELLANLAGTYARCSQRDTISGITSSPWHPHPVILPTHRCMHAWVACVGCGVSVTHVCQKKKNGHTNSQWKWENSRVVRCSCFRDHSRRVAAVMWASLTLSRSSVTNVSATYFLKTRTSQNYSL
jgi:hypothetical protein